MTDEQNALIAMAYEAAADAIDGSLWRLIMRDEGCEKSPCKLRNEGCGCAQKHSRIMHGTIIALTPDAARADLERVKEQARVEERERWAKFCVGMARKRRDEVNRILGELEAHGLESGSVHHELLKLYRSLNREMIEAIRSNRDE